MSTKAIPTQQNCHVRDFAKQIVSEDFDGNVTHAAKAMGISQPTLQALLTQKRGAGQVVLNALADYRKVSIDSVLGRGTSPVDALSMSTPGPSDQAVNEPVGDKVRALRKALGLTHARVEELTQDLPNPISRTDMVKVETGRNAAKTDKFRHGLAVAFGLSRDLLAEYIEGTTTLAECLRKRSVHGALLVASCVVTPGPLSQVLEAYPEWPEEVKLSLRALSHKDYDVEAWTHLGEDYVRAHRRLELSLEMRTQTILAHATRRSGPG